MTSRGAHPTDVEDALAKGGSGTEASDEHPDMPPVARDRAELGILLNPLR